jgi:hypothetical protein
MKFEISETKEDLLSSDYTDAELKEILEQIDVKPSESRKDNIDIIKKNVGKFMVDSKNDIVRAITKWDTNGWLSNFDIDDILTQYNGVNDFYYLGCERLDFWYFKPEKWKEIKLSDLLGKFTKFGLVLNLYGFKFKYRKHWISIFIDTTGKMITIDYLDSSDFKMPDQVAHLLYHFALMFSIYLQKKVQINFNTDIIQQFDGDCGIFAIDFIVKRIKGIHINDYVEMSFSKEEMDNRRRKYFITL